MELLLGVDPGLRATGLALVVRDGDALGVLSLSVLTTKPDGSLSRSADHCRCARIVARGLVEALGRGDASGRRSRPVARMLVEAMSYPPGAKSPARTSLVWGALATLSELYGVPIVQASPQRVKKAVCGSISASKEEVRLAMSKRYGRRRLQTLLAGVPHRLREHAHDALAAATALA